MSAWALILVIFYSSESVHSLEVGFNTEAACTRAGEAVVAKMDRALRSVIFVCARRD